MNQLQHAGMSREDSLLSAAELLSQVAASMASPHAHGLPQLAFRPGAGFDNSLNSPMTPQPQVYIRFSIAVSPYLKAGLPRLASEAGIGSGFALMSSIMPLPSIICIAVLALHDNWHLMESLQCGRAR